MRIGKTERVLGAVSQGDGGGQGSWEACVKTLKRKAGSSTDWREPHLAEQSPGRGESPQLGLEHCPRVSMEPGVEVGLRRKDDASACPGVAKGATFSLFPCLCSLHTYTHVYPRYSRAGENPNATTGFISSFVLANRRDLLILSS